MGRDNRQPNGCMSSERFCPKLSVHSVSLYRALLEGARVLPPLPANRDEGHETRLRQRVAPAMAGSVLHDAITLAQMDPLSVVQFQRHLATNHDPIIDGIRCVHAWSTAFEMVAHARDLFRQFPQRTLESDTR